MWNRNQIVNAKNAEYATSADFCQIFDKDMSSLYLLSLLLTGDHKKAEECFVAGLENAVDRNRVFKDWARGWARRVIIQNALRTVDPHPKKESILNSASIEANDKTAAERPEIADSFGIHTTRCSRGTSSRTAKNRKRGRILPRPEGKSRDTGADRR